MKTCKDCGESKGEGEFYPVKNMKDGLMLRCKKCFAKYSYASRKRRLTEMLPEQLAVIRKRNSEYSREWAKKNPNAQLEANRRFYEKNRSREKVKNRLSYAIRAGNIVREPCFICGSMEKVHGHHPDYSAPLSVVWLCREHHTQLHREAKGYMI